MKFLKHRAIIILIAVIALLGAITIIISIKISINMVEKQNQLVKSSTPAVESTLKDDAKPVASVNIDKAEKFPIFFNGEKQEGLIYYINDKGNALLPFDIILNNLKVGFNLFNSDDAFKANINGKLLLLKLGSPNASFSGKSIKLQCAAIAAKNHIMVSPEILDIMSVLKSSRNADEGSIFINYWPADKNKGYQDVRLFRLEDGSLDISAVFNGKPFKYEKMGKVDYAAYYSELSAYMIRSGEKTYYINKKNYKKPRVLNIGREYAISVDGRFFYWLNKEDNSLHIYTVKSGEKKKLNGKEAKWGRFLTSSSYNLLDYKSGSKYIRIDFQRDDSNDIYTVIQRNGKVAAEGKSSYSPDHSRLLYYNMDKGYNIVDADGTDNVNIGNATNAEWVDNDRIFIVTGDSSYIYDRNNKRRINTDLQWRFAGQSPDGDVFVMKGNVLFRVSGSTENKLFELPWKCEYAYGTSNKDSYILLSKEDDSIFLFSNERSMLAGRPGLFLNTTQDGGVNTGFSDNTAVSPDKGKMAILQRGQVFAEINIVNLIDMKIKNLVLNYPLSKYDTGTHFNLLWLDNDRIMVYTSRHGWLIDLVNGTYIHEWAEKEDDTTVGVFRPAQ